MFSPSGWRSCRLPASPQNTPTSSVNSSKHPTTSRCRKQSSLAVCPYTVLLDPFQFHPPPRWGLLHRAPEKHRSWTSSWLLPRAECEENPPQIIPDVNGHAAKLDCFLIIFSRLLWKLPNLSSTTSRLSRLCLKCLDTTKNSLSFLFVKTSWGKTIAQEVFFKVSMLTPNIYLFVFTPSAHYVPAGDSSRRWCLCPNQVACIYPDQNMMSLSTPLCLPVMSSRPLCCWVWSVDSDASPEREKSLELIRYLVPDVFNGALVDSLSGHALSAAGLAASFLLEAQERAQLPAPPISICSVIKAQKPGWLLTSNPVSCCWKPVFYIRRGQPQKGDEAVVKIILNVFRNCRLTTSLFFCFGLWIWSLFIWVRRTFSSTLGLILWKVFDILMCCWSVREEESDECHDLI